MSDYMNEEQIKNTIVLPYFSQMGFDKDEIEFETNFKILLPRENYKEINGTVNNIKEKNVYSDILYKCRIGGVLRNIFIVEVKSEKHVINERDINQGITYARLLEDIAPFVIITNGKESKVYDTITKKQINNIKSSYYIYNGFQITVNEEIRREAYKLLLGLDSNNLIEICNQQSNENWGDILTYTLNEKNVSTQLNYGRTKYLDDIENFIHSDKKVYPLLGKSGIGKTNIIYSFWKKYHDKYPIMFYNAGLLSKGLCEKIVEDFEFLISRKYTIANLLQEVDSIVKKNQQKLVVIIDGIDEYKNILNLKNDLNDLVKKIIGMNIIFIVSCKVTEMENDIWNQVIYFNGNINTIGDVLYQSDKFYNINLKGNEVEVLDSFEIKKIWGIYKEVYKVQGDLENEAKELAVTPLLMRMLCEIYQNTKIESEISEVGLYKKWLSFKMKQLSNFQMSKIILIKIVNEMVGKSSNVILLDEIYALFSQSDIVDISIKDLIRYNILEDSKDEWGNDIVRIVNEYLQQYIYCYECQKWNLKSMEELARIFNGFIHNEYIQQYIMFYLTSRSRKEAFSQINKSSEKIICSFCGKQIKYGDKQTIVLEVNNKNVGEMNMVNLINGYKVVHESCIKDMPSMLVINPKLLHLYVNCNDFVAIFKSIKLLKYIPKSKLMARAREIEKNKYLKKDHEHILPKKNDIGDPFYVIMQFIDEVNTGKVQSRNMNNRNYLLLFLSEDVAERYLELLKEERKRAILSFDEKISEDCVVGLKKEYFYNLRKKCSDSVLQGVDVIIVKKFISTTNIFGQEDTLINVVNKMIV